MIENLYGIQKMTLLDFPGKVAATVFLGGCDLRCPFCHNFELATGRAPAVMSVSGLMEFLEKRKGLLDGVAITGGEPCIHGDLPDLIRDIRQLGYLIKLDTNGFHPKMLGRLLEEQLLDYVAVDIKNSPDKYAETCGLKELELEPLYESIRLLRESDVPYEFRTTVVDQYHEESDFHKIGRMIEGAPAYYLQQFTERDTVPDQHLVSPSKEKMALYLGIAKQYIPASAVRGVD